MLLHPVAHVTLWSSEMMTRQRKPLLIFLLGLLSASSISLTSPLLTPHVPVQGRGLNHVADPWLISKIPIPLGCILCVLCLPLCLFWDDCASVLSGAFSVALFILVVLDFSRVVEVPGLHICLICPSPSFPYRRDKMQYQVRTGLRYFGSGEGLQFAFFFITQIPV